MQSTPPSRSGLRLAPVLASAIIWVAVIAGSAVVAPEVFGRLIPILGGGAAAHIIILGSLERRSGQSH